MHTGTGQVLKPRAVALQSIAQMFMSLLLECSFAGRGDSARYNSTDKNHCSQKIGLIGHQVARHKEGNSKGLGDLRGA